MSSARRANLHQPVAFVRGFRRHLAERGWQGDSKGRKAREPGRCPALNWIRLAILEQRPEESRDRVAVRDERLRGSVASVERKSREQCSAAMRGLRKFTNQRVFRIG